MSTAIGERLAQARKQAGMTQAQAAQIAGVHEVTYQRYEAGSIEPKGKVLLPLARAWDKTLDWFYQNGSEDTAVSAEAKEG